VHLVGFYYTNSAATVHYILQMEAATSSETSINFDQTLRRHIQEDCALQSQPIRPPVTTKHVTLLSNPTSKHTRSVTFVIG